ncbi:unnamed protein product [Effrenium voratum]|nr:unnamed protein product [Effrenium voratum]
MTAMVANTPSEKLQIQYVRKVRGSRLLVAHIHHPIAGIPFKFHHAILDVAQWQLIHYSQSDDPQGVGLGSSDSSGSQCIVRMHNFDDYPSCWRVVWASSSQTKAQEVLGKARSQLGQGDYSFLLNIGEHFATWCVSGQPSTHAAAHAATHAAATSSAAVAHAAARAATAAGMKTLAVATASSGESTAFALKFGSFAICGATSGGASTATATSGGASTALAATSGGASTALAAGTATAAAATSGGAAGTATAAAATSGGASTTLAATSGGASTALAAGTATAAAATSGAAAATSGGASTAIVGSSGASTAGASTAAAGTSGVATTLSTTLAKALSVASQPAFAIPAAAAFAASCWRLYGKAKVAARAPIGVHNDTESPVKVWLTNNDCLALHDWVHSARATVGVGSTSLTLEPREFRELCPPAEDELFHSFTLRAKQGFRERALRVMRGDVVTWQGNFLIQMSG